MKTYSHEHEAKIAHCVRTHKRFPLFFASKRCFFDLNQNTCFSSTQTGCSTTADHLKRPERPRNMPPHAAACTNGNRAAAACTGAKSLRQDMTKAAPGHTRTCMQAGRTYRPERDKTTITQRHQRRVDTMPSTTKLSLTPPEAPTDTGDLTVIWRVDGL